MPTMQELERALVNADRAGDTNAARALVQEIKNFQAQPSQPQGDTSYGTAFEYGDLTTRANTLNYAADANQAMDDGLLGDFTRFGRENIGNPVREFFGFDPINTDQVNAQYEANNRAQADALNQQAGDLNYRSLTTDDVTGLGSALTYAGQKVAESAPAMIPSIAAPAIATPLIMSGEVNEGLKSIEGLSLDERVRLATAGGTIMTLLENLGAGVVLKGIPKEVLGKMGVKQVADLLNKRGMGRIAAAFTAGAATEGLTEAAQETVKIGTEAIAGKDFAAGEIGTRLKEAGAAGFAAGGAIRGSGTAISETAKAASNAAENMDGLKAIHGGDKEALADVSRDVVQLSSQFNDRNPTKSLDDADATLRDLHTAYMKQFDEAKRRAQSAGIDTSSADFATAERRAKNRAKNEASNADIDYLSQVDPELGALARKLNVITRFTQKGVKGGVSQFTDLLNPIEGLKKSGTFGRGVGGMQATGASALAAYTSGGTIAASVGGRLIDAATGSRNRVNKAINKYSNRAGIDTSGQGQVQQNEAAATAESEALTRAKATQAANLQQQNIANLKAGYDSVGGAEAAMRQRTGLNRQQTAVALRSLKRSRPDLAPTIKSYEESLKTGSRVGEQSREFYNLQDAIVGRAKELGMEVSNAVPLTLNEYNAQLDELIDIEKGFDLFVNDARKAKDAAAAEIDARLERNEITLEEAKKLEAALPENKDYNNARQLKRQATANIDIFVKRNSQDASPNQNQMLQPNSMAANFARGGIGNPIAYQATVDNAMRTAQVAVDNAPTPELAQLANKVANARTKALKQAQLEEALANNPEHKDYLLNVVAPLVEFGPVEKKQESRFGVPGSDIIQEEMDAGQELYGDRMVILNHGTSKSSASAIDASGFSTPSVFAAVDPADADKFAQTTLNLKDNGRITMMWPEKIFEQLKRNKLIKTEPYKTPFGTTINEYVVSPTALDRADIFRSRSLHKAGNKITDAQRAQLVADALGNGFKVQFNASDDAYYRRQELITLTSNGDKRKVLHEIFHAVENRLTPEEMSIIQSHPTYKDVMAEVEELYPDLNTSAKMLEGLAETAARLQEARSENMGRVKYILSRIKDLIEAFKQLIDGNGFTNVNNILDDVYTGKAHQRQINEHYADLYVPDIAYAKKDKPGGPMVAKRLAALDKIQELAKNAKTIAPTINSQYDEAMTNIANNLGLPSVSPEVLKKTLSRVTPNTDLGMVAADYLRAIGVMNDQGIVNKDPDADIDEVVSQHRNDFLVLLKALQKAGVIGDFGLAFRTSAGGRMYPVHMLVPKLPALEAKAELNNVRKFENRAKPTHWEGKIEINGHPFGNYDNTEAFIDREQKQALVINDKIYEMMDKMQSTPQIHRGLDLIYKKDGTTDSAYTLAAAEALKQYKDNQGENGGMTPLFMKRRAQDRLRVDTLNGSASYQGKAGKAIWEFPNWEPLGESGFEQMLHSMRDHFGISNELPYNERVGFLFGTVGQYMQLAGRPASDAIPQSDLDMPLIDYLVNAYGQDGSYVFSHTRGGTPKLFLDKQSGTTLYQKNHALFDVADHGFEIQRAAIELGRMRSYLENIIPGAKKIPSSELFMMPESQQALSDFRSSYPVWFDGTSSSYQLHAVLTGDANLAQETNIGPMDPDGPGGDLYRPGAEYLQRALDLPQTKTRKITKKFISNRRSYGQVKLTALKSGADEIAKSVPAYAERDEGGQWPQQIKDSLKQIQNDLELQFDTRFPGAAMAEGVAKSIASTMYNMQGQDMFAVRVPLPDGDVAVYTGKLPDSAKKRVKWSIDKDKNIAVPVFEDKKAITGFAAFLNHSLDAYVQRELAKRLRANGATGFMHTHDAFAVHAKNGELMRQLYWQILREIAGQPIYQKILEANGLDPNSMSVRYNITTPEGSQTAERPMADVLQQIEQQKSMTFGQEAEPNFYALS